MSHLVAAIRTKIYLSYWHHVNLGSISNVDFIAPAANQWRESTGVRKALPIWFRSLRYIFPSMEILAQAAFTFLEGNEQYWIFHLQFLQCMLHPVYFAKMEIYWTVTKRGFGKRWAHAAVFCALFRKCKFPCISSPLLLYLLLQMPYKVYLLLSKSNNRIFNKS